MVWVLITGLLRVLCICPGKPNPVTVPKAPTMQNGTWRLMVVDDAAGDQGQIAGGWSIRCIRLRVVLLPREL